MTQQQFSQAIDMAPATLSSIFNGRTKPTLNIVEAIKRKFPDISTDWIMFGTGGMHTPSSPTTTASDGTPEGAEGKPVTAQEPTIDFGAMDPSLPDGGHQGGQAERAVLGVRAMHHGSVAEKVKYIDKPQRKITEIRVYFDDLTFETFVPAK